MTRNNVEKTYTDKTTGKFARGNPGRPPGSRHKVTLAVEALLENQFEQITQKCIEKALEGDVAALKLCLARIAPPRRDCPVQFDLPVMKSASDATNAVEAVLAAVSGGDVTPLEGLTIMALVEEYRRTLELSEFEDRINALESAVETDAG